MNKLQNIKLDSSIIVNNSLNGKSMNFYIYLLGNLIGSVSVNKDFEIKELYKDGIGIYIEGFGLAELNEYETSIELYELILSEKNIQLFNTIIANQNDIVDYLFNSVGSYSDDNEQIIFILFVKHLKELLKNVY